MYSLDQFPLPYTVANLAPYISTTTMEYHHGKHLATYIKNLNDLIVGTQYESMPLMEIIMNSSRDANATKIFNNAAQVFNHDFFFHSMHGRPNGEIIPAVADTFGGPDEFKRQFRAAAMAVFGSGWTWLIQNEDGAIQIMTTANADTPIVHGLKPLLALDVWEHAYYIDYQNRRAEYIDAFFNVINWDFVTQNIAA